jgi:hypothetical protein
MHVATMATALRRLVRLATRSNSVPRRFIAAAAGAAVAGSTAGGGSGVGAVGADVYDVAIVGGGIVGLATAREILGRFPNKRVVVLEKEAEVSLHQSG